MLIVEDNIAVNALQQTLSSAQNTSTVPAPVPVFNIQICTSSRPSTANKW